MGILEWVIAIILFGLLFGPYLFNLVTSTIAIFVYKPKRSIVTWLWVELTVLFVGIMWIPILTIGDGKVFYRVRDWEWEVRECSETAS